MDFLRCLKALGIYIYISIYLYIYIYICMYVYAEKWFLRACRAIEAPSHQGEKPREVVSTMKGSLIVLDFHICRHHLLKRVALKLEHARRRNEDAGH